MNTPSLTSRLLNQLNDNVVIMAGHQVLQSSDQYLDLGIFPQTTWRIGLTIAREIHNTGRKVALCMLINDWQLRRLEGLKSKEAYWENAAFALEEIEGHPDLLLPGEPIGTVRTQPMHRGRISESRKQNQFATRLSRDEKLRSNLSDAMRELCMPSGGGGCHVNGCTSEYLQFVPEMWNAGYDTVLSFIPSACRGYIRHASEILETGIVVPATNTRRRLLNVFMASGFAGTRPAKTEEDLFAASDFSVEEHTL
jgi:hypothetical protein